MSDLLPCPFCGGTPTIERAGTLRQSMIVACEDCGCRLESNEIGPPFMWNHRASADRIAELEAALAFYADPDTYHAISFFSDPPCGLFMNDFSDADDWCEFPYRRPMPGNLARATLQGDSDE